MNILTQNSKKSKTLAHHNTLYSITKTPLLNYNYKGPSPYGVQRGSRIIPKSVFIKHHDEILHDLRQLGLSDKESWAVIRLVRFWVYYGQAYPKAETVCGGEQVLNTSTGDIETIGAYCSKRTFWYAVEQLEKMGLLERIKQFFNGYQSSNFYRLDKLILYLASRIAEHGHLLLTAFQADLLRWFKEVWADRGDFDVNLSLEAPIQRITPAASLSL